VMTTTERPQMVRRGSPEIAVDASSAAARRTNFSRTSARLTVARNPRVSETMVWASGLGGRLSLEFLLC
jgi:hypothetical protein